MSDLKILEFSSFKPHPLHDKHDLRVSWGGGGVSIYIYIYIMSDHRQLYILARTEITMLPAGHGTVALSACALKESWSGLGCLATQVLRALEF